MEMMHNYKKGEENEKNSSDYRGNDLCFFDAPLNFCHGS